MSANKGAAMPNKTIYVSDGDLPLYQRAQDLAGGNLSGVISEALRRYVEREEASEAGFDEVTLRVGTGVRRQVRFTAVLLGEWGRIEAGVVEKVAVYRGRSGKFVIYRERPQQRGSWSPGNWRGFLGMGDQSWSFAEGGGAVEVVDTMDELRSKLPAEWCDSIAVALGEPSVDYLDV